MSRGDGEAIPEDDEDRDGLDVKKKKNLTDAKINGLLGARRCQTYEVCLGASVICNLFLICLL